MIILVAIIDVIHQSTRKDLPVINRVSLMVCVCSGVGLTLIRPPLPQIHHSQTGATTQIRAVLVQ
jgi:hypothetical protein